MKLARLLLFSQKRLSSFLSLFPLLLCSLALLFFILPAFSQQRWTRTYGESGNDEALSVQQTSDGGYIITGMTYSYGAWNGNVYLFKTDSSGVPLFTKNYGGAHSAWGLSVKQTSDRGYIIVGFIRLDSMGENTYLLKTDSLGDTLWTNTYRGPFWERGCSVQQTPDGGYIIAGGTETFVGHDDVKLTRVNASGDTLWTRTYGGTGDDWCSSAEMTSDGGFIIVGTTFSFGDPLGDVYLVKTDPSGDTLWTRYYGGTNEERGYSVWQTTDGGYILAGGTSSFGVESTDVYLVKTDPSGDTLWTRTYGGSGYDWGYSVQPCKDGGYIVAGSTGSFGAGNNDVYLIKTNASGDTLWTRTFGGGNYECGYFVLQTTDGGYVIAGYTNSFGAGGYDVYLIKTDGNGNVGVEVSPSHQSRVTGYGVFPNPFTSFASVPGHSSDRFALYDISGRRVGSYKGDRVGADVRPGVYFLRLEGKVGKPMRVVKVR